jgi:predicted transcriptional regulator
VEETGAGEKAAEGTAAAGRVVAAKAGVVMAEAVEGGLAAVTGEAVSEEREEEATAAAATAAGEKAAAEGRVAVAAMVGAWVRSHCRSWSAWGWRTCRTAGGPCRCKRGTGSRERYRRSIPECCWQRHTQSLLWQ